MVGSEGLQAGRNGEVENERTDILKRRMPG
jgi:hypothetical protein